jgi:hypothetical protein
MAHAAIQALREGGPGLRLQSSRRLHRISSVQL